MPVYEYKCCKCSFEFETRKSYTEDISVTSCPKCGKDASKLFVPVPIIFKGSGFYVTDSRGENPALGESKTSGKTETVAEAKPESKVESKAGSKPAETKAASAA